MASMIGGAISLIGALFSWFITGAMRARVGFLEDELAAIRERNLSQVRRQAAAKRWENEDVANAELEAALKEVTANTARSPWWRKHGVQSKTHTS